MAKKNSSLTLARTIADAALEKQAVDVVILDLRELDAITDCFVICTGDVDQQVRAIADNIEKQVKAKTDDRLLHREGKGALNWVILDYVNVVAHIFKPSFREFYRLENLWGDAEAIPVEDKSLGKPTPVKRKVAIAASETRATPKANLRKPAAKKVATKKSVKKSVVKKAATTHNPVSRTPKKKS